jgi:proline racemase/trans-L-3-hydroxyproline dehydratase
VTAVDYHTAGEPFRIVTGGVPPVRGRTMLDRRAYAAEHLDRYRQLLVNEPRGHADMYGCFVTDPDDPGADLGVVFFHTAGYSTACGHGTIALVTWAIESGYLERPEGSAVVTVDVPSGRLRTVASVGPDRVRSVRFRNVPSFVTDRDVQVQTSAGPVVADLSYGGAFYASVRSADIGLRVRPDALPALISIGREVQGELNGRGLAAHPEDERLSGVYGVIFFDELEPSDGRARQRNVTVFADGEVDRSPCGSGTSARLAVLHARGSLGLGEAFVHEGIVGTRFLASVVEETTVHGRAAVVTEVEGSASPTGYHRFVLVLGDEVGTGFLLR